MVVNLDSNVVFASPDVTAPVTVDVGGRASLSSGSDHALTPESQTSIETPYINYRIKLPPGCFNDPANDICEGIPEELNGALLPKVLIPSDMWATAVDQDIWHETFVVPAYMGGVFIGRLGKNVRELKNVWQAEFCLNTYPGRQDALILQLSCPLKHKNEVLHWVSRRIRMRPSRTPIGNPNRLRRFLPLGEPVPVHVRSLYASKELFVTIRDDEYSRYLHMQSEMDQDYFSVNNFRMQLCEPVTSGTVAVVPHSQGFARAIIISVYPTWPKSVLYFLLDHGTFGIVALTKLKKIRAKYMRTPFQAIHVSWAHAFPIFSDVPDIHVLRTFFTGGRVHAFAVRMETCCRASVAFGEPYPPPYSASGMSDYLVTACNSGLYMAAPLALYHSRQSWLNGTGISYYPFSYSAIDYPALVSFVHEERPFVPPQPPYVGCPSGYWSQDSGGHISNDTLNCPSSQPYRTNIYRGGGIRHRDMFHLRPPCRAGISTHSSSSQKENEYSVSPVQDTPTKLVTNHTTTNESNTSTEPKRIPLGMRNSRGGNSANFRRPCNRGRGKSNNPRVTD
ncbi:unnamed protein product [Dicrocoelium dendriticum]|nr:unnamed protein product [Dicrocoelium dendriticum]